MEYAAAWEKLTIERCDIVWIASGISMGGAERQISYLAPALTQRGLRCAVINVNLRAGTAWLRDDVRLGKTRHARVIAKVFEVARLLRSWRPKIVHGWHYHCNLYAGISGHLAGVKVRLGSIRNDLLFEYKVSRSYWRPLVFRSVQGLVANTRRAMANRRLIAYPFPPGITIYNGIDPGEWQGPGNGLSPEVSSCNENFVLGVVARIAWEKAPLLFVEAFERFRHEINNARAWWIGEGPLRAAMEQEITRRNLGSHLKLLGRQPDIRKILPQISVMTLTSIHEGMPNSLMEGAVNGLPAVATDVGGSPEVIEDGVTGLIVPPEDSSRLVDAWKKLAVDSASRTKMGQAAQRRMEQYFSLGRMVGNYVNLYQRLSEGESFADLAVGWEP